MSKQIVYNKEKNALYFHNNDIQYRVDLTEFELENLNPQYKVVDRVDEIFNAISGDIDKMEKKLKTIIKVIFKISVKYRGSKISCKTSFKEKERELVSDNNLNFSFVINLGKFTFNEVVTTPLQDAEFSNINNLDINDINSIGKLLFESLQNEYKNFDFSLKIDNMNFHRPNQNTIESCNKF
jgi:hypothetical protein